MSAASCCPDTGSVFDDAVRQIKQMLPGIPNKVVRRELSDAAVMFCQRSEIWRFVFEEITPVAGDDVVTLEPDQGVQVARTIEVFNTGDGSGCSGSSGCEIRIPERENVWRCGGDQYWYENMPGTLIFNEALSGSELLRAAVALRPERGGDNFPEELMLRYQELLQYGALSMAHMMPGQEWTDTERALFYRAQFQQGIQTARLKHQLDVKPYRPTYQHKRGWRAGGNCGC